jgi:integrase
MRALRAQGLDPRLAIQTEDPDDAKETFKSCADALIASKAPGWRNKKHAQQWQNTLRDYVFPFIGRLHPSDVTLAHIKAILTPIWTTKTETANRVRQRIEAVLDWASVHELRSSENPARWKGVLDKIYPAPNQISRVRHHPSCPYSEAPGLVARLRQSSNLSSRCLRLVILTATRSGEARGARWEEFDLEKKTWLIPGERTKAKREHLIPLSKEALELVKSLPLIDNQSFLFPNSRGGCLSDVGLSKALHVIMDGVTVHGFRSSFRQWAAEQTSFPESVCELALAHVNSNRTEAAYQRSDLFERRRELMEAWCGYLSARSEVVSIHKLRVP